MASSKNSDVETFCALRLFIDSWRWEEVPWYVRSGKYLADTATEVLVELKPPPQRLFADSAPATGRANYLRFRLSPSSALALAARVKLAGKEFVGDQRELYLSEEPLAEEMPYERLSNAQKSFLVIAWSRHGEKGSAIKQGKGHTEKIDSALGQDPFPLRFVPAKFHVAVYPQLYPQSRERTVGRYGPQFPADCETLRLYLLGFGLAFMATT